VSSRCVGPGGVLPLPSYSHVARKPKMGLPLFLAACSRLRAMLEPPVSYLKVHGARRCLPGRRLLLTIGTASCACWATRALLLRPTVSFLHHLRQTATVFGRLFKTPGALPWGVTGVLFRARRWGLLAVPVWLVVRHHFDHRLPPALSPPPDCYRYAKKEGHCRRARSSRRSEWLPVWGAQGRGQPSRRLSARG